MSASRKKIGEVHHILRRTFPNVELSTIRYYENEELISPARSPKGYRLYSESDVARLSEILEMRDSGMGLPEIRARFIDRGELDPRLVTKSVKRAARTAATPSVTRPVPERRPVLRTVPDVVEVPELVGPMSGEELLQEFSISASQLNDLQAHRLVSPVMAEGHSVYPIQDVAVVRQAAPLLAQGLAVSDLVPLLRIGQLTSDYVANVTRVLAYLPERECRDATHRASSEIAALAQALIEREIARFLS